MPEIKVLPKAVAELIAAGEVVERPSSVIKELVENSIDAHSTLITVEIKNGGVTYMRVTDNGCGISAKDVTTAFLRHATSKVSSERDLENIATLGFRGEALASISSVSRIEMITKTADEESGTAYSAAGGEILNTDEAGCPDGTTLIVRDLFFNTPARMKFLKKDVAEGNSVAAILEHIALSHPEISFRFIRDGKPVFSTPGDGNLMSAVYTVLGREFASSLIPVNGELGGIKVRGFVCRPTACRPKKNAQFVFLNGRYVRSGTVASALEAAYKNSAMIGRFPAAVLHLTVPYGAVDINVHPAKTEVRFSDERRIFDCVLFSIKNALAAGDVRPEMKLGSSHGQIRMTADEYRQTVIPESKKSSDPLKTYADIIERQVSHTAPIFKSGHIDTGYVITSGNCTSSANVSTVSPKTEPYIKQTEIHTEEINISAPASESLRLAADPVRVIISDEIPKAEETEKTSDLTQVKYIGEAFSTYIIVSVGESLFLIDKHAAHERILFNRLKANAANSPQMLISPEQVHLRGDEYTAVTDNIDALGQAGFDIEDYGDGTVMVRGVPSVLSGENTVSLINEVAANLSNEKSVKIERLERIYETVACRAAVKAGNVSTSEELETLAKSVLSSKEIMYCPHGRPVALEIKKREIEKQIGRIE